MKHWMFNCNHVSERVSISMDTNLPMRQRLMVWIHMMMCYHCRQFKKQLFRMRDLCRRIQHYEPELAADQALSPSSRERIKKALRQA